MCPSRARPARSRTKRIVAKLCSYQPHITLGPRELRDTPSRRVPGALTTSSHIRSAPMATQAQGTPSTIPWVMDPIRSLCINPFIEHRPSAARPVQRVRSDLDVPLGPHKPAMLASSILGEETTTASILWGAGVDPLRRGELSVAPINRSPANKRQRGAPTSQILGEAANPFVPGTEHVAPARLPATAAARALPVSIVLVPNMILSSCSRTYTFVNHIMTLHADHSATAVPTIRASQVIPVLRRSVVPRPLARGASN